MSRLIGAKGHRLHGPGGTRTWQNTDQKDELPWKLFKHLTVELEGLEQVGEIEGHQALI